MSAAVFDVTVPTTLAIHMDPNGGITCGNIVITNNGTEPVEVKDTQITALNGWTLVDYAATTFTDANKGQHKVALQLGSLDSPIAANGGQTTIDVSAKIPYQGAKSTQTDIAQVVLVLGVQAPDASIDWTYTLNGDTITLTGYIGESNDVVVRNKYSVGGKTYDKVELGTTEYVTGTIVIGPFVCSISTSPLTSICFEEGVKLPSYSYLMFYNCSSLTYLDLSCWDTSNVTSMYDMFNGCSRLQTVTLGDKFSFNGATDARLTNLPTPDPNYIPGADGYWYTADGTRYAPSEIPNNTAATYYAVEPVTPKDLTYNISIYLDEAYDDYADNGTFHVEVFAQTDYKLSEPVTITFRKPYYLAGNDASCTLSPVDGGYLGECEVQLYWHYGHYVTMSEVYINNVHVGDMMNMPSMPQMNSVNSEYSFTVNSVQTASVTTLSLDDMGHETQPFDFASLSTSVPSFPAPEPDPTPMPEPNPEPSQYELTISGPAAVETGYTATLAIVKTPEDDTTISWSSSNETIATVDEFGVVTGIGAGEVTISAQVGETVCQWIMTVTDTPDAEADLECRGEANMPILARHAKEPPLAYSCGPYHHCNIKI